MLSFFVRQALSSWEEFYGKDPISHDMHDLHTHQGITGSDINGLYVHDCTFIDIHSDNEKGAALMIEAHKKSLFERLLFSKCSAFEGGAICAYQGHIIFNGLCADQCTGTNGAFLYVNAPLQIHYTSAAKCYAKGDGNQDSSTMFIKKPEESIVTLDTVNLTKNTGEGRAGLFQASGYCTYSTFVDNTCKYNHCFQTSEVFTYFDHVNFVRNAVTENNDKAALYVGTPSVSTNSVGIKSCIFEFNMADSTRWIKTGKKIVLTDCYLPNGNQNSQNIEIDEPRANSYTHAITYYYVDGYCITGKTAPPQTPVQTLQPTTPVQTLQPTESQQKTTEVSTDVTVESSTTKKSANDGGLSTPTPTTKASESGVNLKDGETSNILNKVPIWALVLIVLGVVAIISAIVAYSVIRKRKGNTDISSDDFVSEGADGIRSKDQSVTIDYDLRDAEEDPFKHDFENEDSIEEVLAK